MDIQLSSANNQEARRTAGAKDSGGRQAKTLAAAFERFKQTMPDGSIDERALEALRRMEPARTPKRLQFMVDRGSGQVMVKVIDANTGKVIRVLPPRELLRGSGRIGENTGLLLDKII